MNSTTIPTSEITSLEFNTDPQALSFRHNGKGYWLFTGGDTPKNLNPGLALYEGVRHSTKVTVYDNGDVVNGQSVLTSLTFESAPMVEAPPFNRMQIGFDSAVMLLLLVIVFLLARKPARGTHPERTS